MKLKELCAAIDAVCPARWENTEIPAITTHSGEVVKGGMFLCIRGIHTDGHRYIPQAIENGAIAILVEENADYETYPDAVFLKAANTRRATACLFNAFYGYPTRHLKFIGVTGTNGKTSVTYLIRKILEASLVRCGLIGTVGCESVGRHLDTHNRDPLANMTTPDPEELYRLLREMVRDGVEYVVMEVTSHALSLGKLDPIRFSVAVFTNLTPEHLDFHRTMDAYAEAKAELFARSDCSIVNIDSLYATKMLAMAGGDIITCSEEGRRASYQATDVHFDGKAGVKYLLSSANRRMKLRCPIPGKFTVMNSMQAAICALELGFTPAAVKEALSSVAGVKGRMERVKLGPTADITVLIDYAHTPDALENLLLTARELCAENERMVLLFGCGGDRDRSKRAQMGRIASRLADAVILTSDNSRSEDPMEILAEIEKGFEEKKNYTVLPDRERAIRYAIGHAEKGDLILLAGKGHENYEIGKDGRRPFSETQIVKDAFAIRMNRKKLLNGEGAEHSEK